ncbi:MAG: hypothetical protein PUE15_10805 [Prevotella sp.]|nr:hypothetical protein [Prevotella sp.]
MILQLTKQSTDQEIKAYFEEVLRLSKDSEEFPVNLDEVWPLVYAEKGKAVRALKTNDLFVEGIDFILLAQNGKQDESNGKQVTSWGGNNQVTYMLSVPCLEFFIARKVRPVFEVYRQVFHKVASGELPLRMPNCIPGDTVGTLAPLAQFHANIMERYARVVNDSKGQEEITEIMEECEEYYTRYRLKVANLPYIEAVRNIEGKESLQDRPLYAPVKTKSVVNVTSQHVTVVNK